MCGEGKKIMGECGCGSMNIVDSFLVGNKVMAVDLYRGCSDCGVDIGISLHIFTKKEAKDFCIEPKEEFSPDEYGWKQRHVFNLEMNHVIQAIMKYADELSDYGDLRDFLDDRKYDILQEALNLSSKKEAT